MKGIGWMDVEPVKRRRVEKVPCLNAKRCYGVVRETTKSRLCDGCRSHESDVKRRNDR